MEDVSFKMDNVPQVFALFVKQGAMEGDYVLRHKDGSAIPIHYRAITCADGCHAAVWTPIKDWREPYLAALIETNPKKLARKVEIAMSAIDRAQSSANAADQQAIARRAVGAERAGAKRRAVGKDSRPRPKRFLQRLKPLRLSLLNVRAEALTP